MAGCLSSQENADDFPQSAQTKGVRRPMKHIRRFATTLPAMVALVGCGKMQPPRVETYYTPVINGQSSSLPSCTGGQSASIPREPGGPTFSLAPQSSQLYRKELLLYVSAGGSEQLDVGDFTVNCRTALLTTSGSSYPPSSGDGIQTGKSCGTEAVLATNNMQAHSVELRFDAAKELDDIVTLTLPEVRSMKTGTVYPALSLQLRKSQVQECPTDWSFSH
jgi:hypothetical protein